MLRIVTEITLASIYVSAHNRLEVVVMVDPEIQQAINIIDRKISSLMESRNRLAQAFGLPQPTTSQPTNTYQKASELESISSVAHRAAEAFDNVTSAIQKPRKEALADFLIENGPMSRVDIVARAGIPEGTVSYCLNDKRFFVQKSDGSWDVTDFSRRGRTRGSIGVAQTHYAS